VETLPNPTALAVILPLLVVLAHVAWTDLAERRIANRAVLAVLALLPVELLLLGRPQPWWSGPAAGGLVLAVGLLAWRSGLLGGGDVKLAAALAALVGLAGLADFLLVTALAGGLLAAATLVALRLARPLARAAARLLPLPVAGRLAGYLLSDPAARPASVPYGLALAAGGAWWALGLLDRS
jgi:prepilin peptidase CpaA